MKFPIEIWNSNSLAIDFGMDRVSSAQRLMYLIAAVIGFTAAGLRTSALGVPAMDSYRIVLDLVVTLACIGWCYRANRLVDGIDFLDRLIGFSVANSVRIYLFGILYTGSLVYVGAGLVLVIPGFQPSALTAGLGPLGHALASQAVTLPIYFFWAFLVRRAILQIRDARSEKAENRKSQKARTGRSLWSDSDFRWLILGFALWSWGLIQYVRTGRFPLIVEILPLVESDRAVVTLTASLVLLFFCSALFLKERARRRY